MTEINGSLRNTLGALLRLHQQGSLDRYLTAFRVFQSEEDPRNLSYEDLERAVEMGLLDKVIVDWHTEFSGNIGYRPKQDKINEILEIIRGN